MNYANIEQPTLDYFPCRYGTSKQLFRGPRRRLEGEYAAYIGGTETYGKFIDMPFPALVECDTGIKSVNLGCVNAGIDVYFHDKSLLNICANARVTVVQVMGAPNMSNRYYTVHQRRNDRFLRASPLLETIYPEVDFTDFSFTRHLLSSLAEISAEKFALIVRELKDAWVARMKMMLSQIEGKIVLLWLAEHEPNEEAETDPVGPDPMLVDRRMLDALTGVVTRTVEIVGTDIERYRGLEEMFFADLERPAATELLGPVVHRRVTEALAPLLKDMI